MLFVEEKKQILAMSIIIQQRVLTRTLIEMKKAYPALVYRKLHSLYRKFDPVRGMDYQIHLTLEDQSKRMIVKSFEAVKPLGHVEIVPSPYVTESTRIAMVLPTFEHQIKESFDSIYHYEKTCMEHQDNTFLMLVCRFYLEILF